jgi:ribosomal protein S18 acetylase RimI-like enzyme
LSEYTFSSADYNDIPEIVGIYHSLVGAPGCTWSMDYPSRATAEADINSKSLYILKKDDKIIAVASAGEFNELGHLQWKSKNACELARIGVMPGMHRQGIGTMILREIIKLARDKGYDGIRLLVSKTNPAALFLYNKNGFVKRGEVFLFDIDFYCYEITFGHEA